MNFRIIIIFSAVIINLFFISCEKDSNDLDQYNIKFSVSGIVDNQQVDYKTSFSTIRESYYSYTLDLNDSVRLFNFIRYSNDMNSFIEINLHYDIVNKVIVEDSYHNSLNYSIEFKSNNEELKIEHETVVIGGTYFSYEKFFENVNYDPDTEMINGTFNYEEDYNDEYKISGEFSLCFNK